jgi:hypothetical protein
VTPKTSTGADRAEKLRRRKCFPEFGVAIEPQVVLSSVYAARVGFVAGLVAQGLQELIYLLTNIFFRLRGWALEEAGHHVPCQRQRNGPQHPVMKRPCLPRFFSRAR